jgi:hypothetical protein
LRRYVHPPRLSGLSKVSGLLSELASLATP